MAPIRVAFYYMHMQSEPARPAEEQFQSCWLRTARRMLAYVTTVSRSALCLNSTTANGRQSRRGGDTVAKVLQWERARKDKHAAEVAYARRWRCHSRSEFASKPKNATGSERHSGSTSNCRVLLLLCRNGPHQFGHGETNLEGSKPHGTRKRAAESQSGPQGSAPREACNHAAADQSLSP